MPHKQVALGQPLLPGDELHLEQQYSTARDPPGWWWENEGDRSGLVRAWLCGLPSVPSSRPVTPLGGWRVGGQGVFTESAERGKRVGQTGPAPHLHSPRVPGVGGPPAAASPPHTCPAGLCPVLRSPCWPPELPPGGPRSHAWGGADSQVSALPRSTVHTSRAPIPTQLRAGPRLGWTPFSSCHGPYHVASRAQLPYRKLHPPFPFLPLPLPRDWN